MPPRRPLTNPPRRILPLYPMALAGIIVATEVVELCVDVAYLVGWDETRWGELDLGLDSLLLEIAMDLAVLVVASIVLRWLVRRWVVAQPPDPPG